jgi:subtilase family serine protease
MRRLVSVLGVVGILLGATTPAVAGVTVGASRLTRSVVDVCGPATPGTARCHAKLVVYGNGIQPFASTPSGYGPRDLQSAYSLSSASASAGGGATVAIVDAYDDPKAESDLAVYRSQFPGLPPCTTKNGCFQKVNQSGIAGNYPKGNRGWAEEISLDLDMVSAICPNCKILLVEATSATFADLGTAVNYAASQGSKGVVAISNSYGGAEFNGETSYDQYYKHLGIAITVSSGDSGYGVQYPAASPFVTAVGGTHLTNVSSGNRAWSETAWSGAGSGCSAYEPKPTPPGQTTTWQTNQIDPSCGMRTVADVSAVADPYTGVSVYDTYGGVGGWLVFGGTSVASPIIASVYALAGNASSVIYGSYPYLNGSSTTLNDVTSGSNGSCGGSYLCTAGPGYDGPTGLGTPNGTGGF